jgi:hypothetical protein
LFEKPHEGRPRRLHRLSAHLRLQELSVPVNTIQKARGCINKVCRDGSGTLVFLKTIIPSRKATRQYLGEEPEGHEED